MIRLSDRLMSLTRYIFKEDSVMDVGCDHALLDIYLVQAGIVDNIYVGDVNENALNSGRLNIEKYELTDKIFPILSYGIEKITELNIDTLVISGMGAKNIIDILNSPNLDKIFKLVLQSNNNHADIRRFLTTKGFNIISEEVIYDSKKTYVNIIAIRDTDIITYSDKEYEYGPFLIKDSRNLDYFMELRASQERIYFSSKTEDAQIKLHYLDEIVDNLLQQD